MYSPATSIERVAAFSNGRHGGNPAGVVICEVFPDVPNMQALAAEIGYSETVFAIPQGEDWRVRYFAPAMEVPFCGHATVALGAVLAKRNGNGLFQLRLNNGIRASVEGDISGSLATATLLSPPPTSRPVAQPYLDKALALFGWNDDDLDSGIPPAIINAGADHLLLAVNSRETLSAMRYNQNVGKAIMESEKLATISLVFSEGPQRFHARNPFAAGGVYEDPATGAAAAALGGYLAKIDWPHGGNFTILQGEDMGVPCRILVDIDGNAQTGIRVGGSVRDIV
jgi:PhzF family phenazine biosynthesis protein